MSREELRGKLIEAIWDTKNLHEGWMFMLVKVRTYAPDMTVKEAYELMEEAEKMYLDELYNGRNARLEELRRCNKKEDLS